MLRKHRLKLLSSNLMTTYNPPAPGQIVVTGQLFGMDSLPLSCANGDKKIPRLGMWGEGNLKETHSYFPKGRKWIQRGNKIKLKYTHKQTHEKPTLLRITSVTKNFLFLEVVTVRLLWFLKIFPYLVLSFLITPLAHQPTSTLLWLSRINLPLLLQCVRHLGHISSFFSPTLFFSGLP